ncbi:tapasin-related protein [Pelodytes ibericus]
MDALRHRCFLLSVMLTLHRSQSLCAALSGKTHSVDIVLPCSHVLTDDGGGRGGMGGLSFPKEAVTLVLRNVTVTEEADLDPITDYVQPQSGETTIFQATVTLPALPFADRLLHAECEDEEVVCELAHLYTEFYVAHIRLPDLGVSILLRKELQTGDPSKVDEQLPAEQNIVPVAVDLLLSSFPPSYLTPTSLNISLNCEAWGDPEGLQVEWHLQKGGKGKMIVPEDNTRISIKPGALDSKRDVSLNIRGVSVHDEGTYICTVNSRYHQIQQIIKLQVRESPLVTVLSKRSSELKLICRTDRYYPLDVEVEWLLGGLPVPHAAPVTSSHRQNSDGTYNLTSTLLVPLPLPGTPPDIYTCAVSHVTVSEPIQVHSSVYPPELERSLGIIGLIILSIVIITALQAIFMLKRTWERRRKTE